jgi:hypothetical protein
VSDQASRLLHCLADTAAALPPPDRAGGVDYVRTRSRHRDSRSLLSRDGTLTSTGSEVVLVDRELWISPDGSGRIVELRVGPSRRHQRDLVCEPGALHYFGDLPTEPAALAAALPVRAGTSNAAGFAVLDAVHQVWAARVVPPVLHAAMLRVLARCDVTHRGMSTDALDRPCETFSADDDQRRRQVLLDPETGLLREYQVVVLGPDGTPDHASDRSSYSSFLMSCYVGSTLDRP